jgi:hypothetical protein
MKPFSDIRSKGQFWQGRHRLCAKSYSYVRANRFDEPLRMQPEIVSATNRY